MTFYRFSKEGLEERLVGLREEYGDELDEEKEKVYWDRLDYEVGVIEYDSPVIS